MIKSFQHKGIQSFFGKGSKSGIQPHHAAKLRLQLAALDHAKGPHDLTVPSWRLHSLHRNLEGHWSLTVNGNWRVTFSFDGKDVVLVDYQDYH